MEIIKLESMDCVVPLKSEFDHVPTVVCPAPNASHMGNLTMHPAHLTSMPSSDSLQQQQQQQQQPPAPPSQHPVHDQQKYGQPDVPPMTPNQLNAYDVKGKLFDKKDKFSFVFHFFFF